ncbi:MAG TPA: aspartate aminotransferase family protein [Acidimicrobiaceae bacterium]|nr:aspartate aminotransferase family protein [Acidimicrobiaceae bacterium]
MTPNDDWLGRARRVIPGGVDSPVRSFAAVGGAPYTVVRGEGPYVWDADGTRYVDLVQSYGAVILGHAHPAVTAALSKALASGTSFGAPTPGEVLLAEHITAAVPGCEQVRLVSSGTEAVMSALRVARGFTGRDRVVKFDGCYHGHADALLAGGGSGVATLGLPGSAGVPEAAVADTLVVPYNVVPELDERVACVVVEPVAANMGLVPPQDGFLAGLRAACDAVGALLVFDEVITGFRLARGGASTTFGVRPDLWCFGKVIGGGLPVGAFGGRADVLEVLAPGGPVYQAGTLSGNPLATAAGVAVLETMDDHLYGELARRARRLAAALQGVLAEAGVPAHVPVCGPLVGLFLSRRQVTDYDSARAAVGEGRYPSFFTAMLQQGVALAPGPYEILFPGMAHTDDVLDEVVEAAAKAALVTSSGRR